MEGLKSFISHQDLYQLKNFEADLRKKGLRRGISLIKRVSIMLVMVERGEELLKSEFVRGWVNPVLVVDKSALEMKIY